MINTNGWFKSSFKIIFFNFNMYNSALNWLSYPQHFIEDSLMFITADLMAY